MLLRKQGGSDVIRRKNNIGVLRLLFASFVIIGHAPEQIDGDRHREPLTMMFHSMSLGELSVDAFFLLSGYLITMSMARTPSLYAFLERRVLRIWPGYLVACVLCSFVLAPVVGGHPFSQPPGSFARMVMLLGPIDTPGQLAGLHYPALNGAMWTISLEFKCYLMVAALGAIGILMRVRAMATLTFVALAMMVLGTFDGFRRFLDYFGHQGLTYYLFGRPMGLIAVFLMGAMGYLWREQIATRLSGRTALLAFAACVAFMTNPHTAELGIATLGALALFWLSFRSNIGPFRKINDSWDISYGTYLYGWPIAITILYFNREISPVALAGMALPLALLAGTASWFLVEKRASHLLPRRRASPAPSNIAL